MERKKALTVAAGLSAAVFAAATAIGVNVGILNSAAEDDPSVGSISVDELVDATSTTTAAVPPETIVIDEYVTAAPAGGSPRVAAPIEQRPTSDPGAQSPASAVGEAGSYDDHGGDRYVDDEDEDHDEDDDEDDYEDHEEEDDEEVDEGHDDDD